jgi:hypothetical protein
MHRQSNNRQGDTEDGEGNYYITFGIVDGRQRGIIASRQSWRLRNLCKLLTEYAKKEGNVPADFVYRSFQVNKNCKFKVHVDRNNAPGTTNYTKALGSFTEHGGLWLQGKGKAVDLQTKWCEFDPFTYHCTIPWGPEGSDR